MLIGKSKTIPWQYSSRCGGEVVDDATTNGRLDSPFGPRCIRHTSHEFEQVCHRYGIRLLADTFDGG